MPKEDRSCVISVTTLDIQKSIVEWTETWRNFKNRRNGGRNARNDRSNHESNSKTNKDNEEQKNVVSEFREELNEAFVKGLDISKDKLDDDEIERLKLVIDFDLIKLNFCSQ